MLCQRCHEREAVVHITGVMRRWPFDPTSPTLEVVKQHYCGTCATELRFDTTPPTSREATPRDISERVRITLTTEERVFVQSLSEPETEWHVLANLIPPRLRQVGTELTIIGTPEEIACILERD